MNSEIFERVMQRPQNFHHLSCWEQWKIDKELRILDWCDTDLSEEQLRRYQEKFISEPEKSKPHE